MLELLLLREGLLSYSARALHPFFCWEPAVDWAVFGWFLNHSVSGQPPDDKITLTLYLASESVCKKKKWKWLTLTLWSQAHCLWWIWYDIISLLADVCWRLGRLNLNDRLLNDNRCFSQLVSISKLQVFFWPKQQTVSLVYPGHKTVMVVSFVYISNENKTTCKFKCLFSWLLIGVGMEPRHTKTTVKIQERATKSGNSTPAEGNRCPVWKRCVSSPIVK